ncbi:MAG: hypothetical protein GX147_06895 [Deltaproteobacteria bacterium]|nr:hypothetical protein [Deltaproteobacteria bacterium]
MMFRCSSVLIALMAFFLLVPAVWAENAARDGAMDIGRGLKKAGTDIGKTVRDGGKEAGQGVMRVGKGTGRMIGDKSHGVAREMEKAGQATGRGIKKADRTVRGWCHDAYHTVLKTFSRIGEGIRNTLDSRKIRNR